MVSGGLVYDAAFVLTIALYWLPTIVALSRKAQKTTAVVIVNLLLTWTVIGWFVALWMAATSPRRPGA